MKSKAVTNACQKFYFTDTESDFSEDSSDLEEIAYADMTEKKRKILAEEQEEESTNWLEANCGDLHEERKFIVFESKLKELFSSCLLSQLWPESKKHDADY